MTVRRTAGWVAIAAILATLIGYGILVASAVADARAQADRPDGRIATYLAGADGFDLGLLQRANGLALAVQGADPLSALRPDELARQDVVLLVQLRPLDPAEARALGEWVGAGGRAMLFVEPGTGWDRPGGPWSGASAPLATRLMRGDGRPRSLPDGRRLETRGAGRWADAAGCVPMLDRLVADCRTGSGRVVLVADADLADAQTIGDGGAGAGLVGAIVDALLERRAIDLAGAPAPRLPTTLPAMLLLGLLPMVAIGAGLIWAVLGSEGRSRPARPTRPARIVHDRRAPAQPIPDPADWEDK